MLGRWATGVGLVLLASVPLGCGQSQLDNDPRGGTGGMPAAGKGGDGGVMGGGGGLGGSGGTGDSAGSGSSTIAICSFFGFADDDGDGWGQTESWVCADDYPGNVSGLGGDCDDTDPSIQRGFYRDADGDGTGTVDEFGCFAADAEPAGYAEHGGDCNDTDAEIGPNIVDLSGDGLDRDCYGFDGLDCSVADYCPCSQPPVDQPAPSGCDGVDLAAIELVICSADCTFSGFVRIANVGTEDARGPIRIVGDSAEVLLLEGLAVGTLTEYIRLPFRTGGFTVTGVDEDCNPDNDTLAPPEASGMRTFCIPK